MSPARLTGSLPKPCHILRTILPSLLFCVKKRAFTTAPVRAEDVAFSLEALRAANPFFRAYYRDVAGTEILGPHEIRIRFAASGTANCP